MADSRIEQAEHYERAADSAPEPGIAAHYRTKARRLRDSINPGAAVARYERAASESKNGDTVRGYLQMAQEVRKDNPGWDNTGEDAPANPDAVRQWQRAIQKASLHSRTVRQNLAVNLAHSQKGYKPPRRMKLSEIPADALPEKLSELQREMYEHVRAAENCSEPDLKAFYRDRAGHARAAYRAALDDHGIDDPDMEEE